MLHYKVYIFIDTYNSQGWRQVEKISFHVFSFDDTEEKVAVRFEDEKGQDAVYVITLHKYLDPDNELSIDQSIRFLCVAHLL